MRRLRDITLGDVFDGIGRYRPLAFVLAGILLIAIVSPGRRGAPPQGADAAASLPRSDAAVDSSGQPVAAPQPGANGTASTVQTSGARASVARAQAVAPAVRNVTSDPLQALDCNPVTKRIRFPSVYAPPCVADWPKGADAGAPYRGVTKDKIIVAVRFSDPTPQGQAVAVALGVDDTAEDQRATRQAYVDVFNAHYQTYGRKVELVYFKSSGADEQAGKADAIKVATEIKAFAALGGSGAYRDELVSRGILCIACAVSQSIEIYLNRAPYVWDILMANTQGFVHRMEYTGKRLCGRNAKWAGNPIYQTQKRKVALLSIDSVDQSIYRPGAEFGAKEIQKYGCKLDDLIYYLSDLASAQEQARTIIARLKDKGITSVMFAGDPVAPIFFTQEATRQQYQPEWIITGSALTDTTFFGRTYDQTQWSHAFGISYLAARVPLEVSEAWRIHVWHHGKPPQAEDTFSVIYPYVELLFLGIHQAGPKLTPQTFRDGMFAYPLTGGGIINVSKSFGRHGLFPWDDYLAYDDATEIWWDQTARGRDENGNEGVGMYRYVLGGKRYIPGQWPSTDPPAFDPAGTVLVYDKLPPADAFPEYEHKHYR